MTDLKVLKIQSSCDPMASHVVIRDDSGLRDKCNVDLKDQEYKILPYEEKP